jgi:hypothetical protein
VSIRAINTATGAVAGTWPATLIRGTWRATLPGSAFAYQQGYRIQVRAIDAAKNSTGYVDTRASFYVYVCLT